MTEAHACAHKIKSPKPQVGPTYHPSLNFSPLKFLSRKLRRNCSKTWPTWWRGTSVTAAEASCLTDPWCRSNLLTRVAMATILFPTEDTTVVSMNRSRWLWMGEQVLAVDFEGWGRIELFLSKKGCGTFRSNNILLCVKFSLYYNTLLD